MTLQTYSKEEIDRLVAENKRLHDLHLERTKLTHKVLLDVAERDKRIMELETLCDPAGMVAENALLKDQTRQLDAMIGRLKRRIGQLEAALKVIVRFPFPEAEVKKTAEKALRSVGNSDGG